MGIPPPNKYVEKDAMKHIVNALAHIVAKEPGRWALQHVKITNKYIIATNGLIMSKVEHLDNVLGRIVGSIYIHYDKTVELRSALKHNTGVSLYAYNDLLLHNRLLNIHVSDYPNIDNLAPKKIVKRISFNAKYLLALTKGLNCTNGNNIVVFELGENNLAFIKVTMPGSTGAVGVIAPCNCVDVKSPTKTSESDLPRGSK